jgi:hypothetical protein
VVDVSESRLTPFAKNISVLDESVSIKEILPVFDSGNLPSVQQSALYPLDGFTPIYDGGGQANAYPHFTVRDKQGTIARRGLSVVRDFWQRRKTFSNVHISDCCLIYLRDGLPNIFDGDIEKMHIGLPFVRGNNGVSGLPCWTKFWGTTQWRSYDPRSFAASEVSSLATYHPPLHKQGNTLQTSNDDQPSCEDYELPLYRYILICAGCMFLSAWASLIIGKSRWQTILGGFIILLCGIGYLTDLGGAAFGDPFTFWGLGFLCKC